MSDASSGRIMICPASGWSSVSRPSASSRRAVTAISAGSVTPRRKFAFTPQPPSTFALAWATAQSRSNGSHAPGESVTASSSSRPIAFSGCRTMWASRRRHFLAGGLPGLVSGAFASASAGLRLKLDRMLPKTSGL